MIPIRDLVGLAHARRHWKPNAIFGDQMGQYDGIDLTMGGALPLSHAEELAMLRGTWLMVQERKARLGIKS